MKFNSLVVKILNPSVWKRMFNLLKKKIIKGSTLRIWRNTFQAFSSNAIIAYWWRGRDNKNWGDKINPVIIELLSGKKVIHVDDVINFRFLNVYTCIGSIIEHLRYKGIHIWGPGIISETSTIKIKPKKIHAVRGPFTRGRLKSEGFDCPEVYGDPALLLPRFYHPEVEKTIDLGIIPHFVDKENELLQKLEKKGIFIIDIFGGETEFIDHICRCKRIVSSSLHGLIVADAYGIPTKWMKVSDKIYGDNFKYNDYYQSIGVTGEKPFIVNENTTSIDLINSCWEKDPEIDLDRLLAACPFYQPDRDKLTINNLQYATFQSM